MLRLIKRVVSTNNDNKSDRKDSIQKNQGNKAQEVKIEQPIEKIADKTQEIIFDEAMPVSLPAGNISPPLLNMMGGYLNDDIQVSTYSPANKHKLTIFGRDVADHVYQQTIAVALNFVLPACPLDELEAEIRKNPNVLLPTIEIDGMKGTLLELAIMRLDQTIKMKEGVDEGMAERLMRLQTEFFPESKQEVLLRAQNASRPADEKEKKSRDTANLSALTTAVDAIKANKPREDVIKNFKEYLKSTKPAVMTDNKYNLNLLQLIPDAIEMLGNRIKDLDGWCSDKAFRFCLEVIATIEDELPDRQKQILMSGVYQLLNENKKADRVRIASNSSFRGVPGSDWLFAVNYFYDVYGDAARRARLVLRCGGARRGFSRLMSAITSAARDLCCSQVHTRRAGNR